MSCIIEGASPTKYIVVYCKIDKTNGSATYGVLSAHDNEDAAEQAIENAKKNENSTTKYTIAEMQ